MIDTNDDESEDKCSTYQVLWKSVNGFGRNDGLSFSLFIDLVSI